MSYLYYGIRRVLLRLLNRRLGILGATAVVSLVSATSTGGSHVAVWMGVSTHNAQSWLQAGIEQSGGDTHPWEYIERGRGGVQVSLNEWPTTIGHKARITLKERGSLWQITIDGHTSKWVYIPKAETSTLSLLEVYHQGGVAHAVATIGTRRVSG